MKYVQVVVSNKSNYTDTFYTYGSETDVKPGQKVNVPFGRGKKLKEGFVAGILEKLPEDLPFDKLKYIESVDEEISLTEEIVETAIWIRNRYMSKYMDSLKLFLPAGSKAKRRISREVVDDYEGEEQNISCLTDEQEKAFGEISAALEEERHSVFLLEGVTGSGKTEVYMQAVAKAIALGKTGVVVVPEVALTKQIIDRFIVRFGRDKVAVMHSKMTAGERYDQWQKIRSGSVQIVIGARSAVFAPVENIGVIIIDEEHESSYKSDMSPKYETWRVAAKRAGFYGGSVILGSGTPSVESLYRAEKGEFIKLRLTERYNKMPMPEASIVDRREELKEGNKTVFSRLLYDRVREALDSGGQVILFINRRGYSPHVFCRECGYVVKCGNCNTPMNYHKKTGKLLCHTCGRKMNQPDVCPECGSRYIRYFGAGTEQIEEAAGKLFKDVTVERLDTDTGTNIKEINRILDNFNKGKTRILVGTQLVGKGMDNPNVKLVGIMAIDTMINYPDYRAQERAFQLITQAAGRAGRGTEAGRVVIQTYNPQAYPVVYGGAHDVENFYKNEIKRRMLLNNPPFSTIVQIVITGKDKTGREVSELSGKFIKKAENLIGKNKVLSIKNRKRDTDYQRCILFKFENEMADKFRNLVNGFRDEMRENKIPCSFIAEFEPNSIWR